MLLQPQHLPYKSGVHFGEAFFNFFQVSDSRLIAEGRAGVPQNKIRQGGGIRQREHASCGTPRRLARCYGALIPILPAHCPHRAPCSAGVLTLALIGIQG